MSEYVKFKKFSELPELTEPLEPIGVYLKTFLQKEQEGYNTFDAALCGIWAASEYERRIKMKKFTIDDIREFDMVTLRSGTKTVVLNDKWGAPRLLSTDGHSLDMSKSYAYGPNFKCCTHEEDKDDIMEIRRPMFGTIYTDKKRWDDEPIIWKREPEIKEMTVSEISEALGYTVKVVE